ncbi:unnamed protein product [Protopolystoma xenopodis]|uniref:Uncharacterized protein n=1 Tax=Protopolystoma xenopodis TaxID=117903 RepID=A0A3S5B3D2_9PLAT|nr:unnamed protein product [Protopolystoma xenopodis]
MVSWLNYRPAGRVGRQAGVEKHTASSCLGPDTAETGTREAAHLRNHASPCLRVHSGKVASILAQQQPLRL